MYMLTTVKTGKRVIHDAQTLKYQSLESTLYLLAPSQTSQVGIKLVKHHL
jgi:hypothetical protein